jgi:hypothetical protein
MSKFVGKVKEDRKKQEIVCQIVKHPKGNGGHRKYPEVKGMVMVEKMCRMN